MKPGKFVIYDKVRKIKGYAFPGIVVSVFWNLKGDIRYVIEADEPRFSGMLHIFNEEQLEFRNASEDQLR